MSEKGHSLKRAGKLPSGLCCAGCWEAGLCCEAAQLLGGWDGCLKGSGCQLVDKHCITPIGPQGPNILTRNSRHFHVKDESQNPAKYPKGW